MVDQLSINDEEVFVFLNFDVKITQKEIESYLNEKNVNYTKIEIIHINEKSNNIKIHFHANAIAYTQLELLKNEVFPKHKNQIIKIQFFNSGVIGHLIQLPNENEIIDYQIEYDKLLVNEYERKLGSDGLIFTNTNVIEKQRAVAGYMIKNIGLNLIKGKSIMNVSLPINIFDTRSILELYAWQNAYAAILLERGGQAIDKMEKLKWSTAFAVTRFHLSGAQLKPFNPILGETFQCKIEDSLFYFEQTCHHPPILNFYCIGKNYKIYGHNESEASTGANSVKCFYKGNFIVEYPDGTKHKIIYPTLKISGTMMGSRMLKFRGKVFVVDEKNDWIVELSVDPDERGFFKKITSKKQTYPDYFKGLVTNISSNTKYDKKENTYNIINRDKSIIASLEGEFTNYLKFHGQTIWEYSAYTFPKFRRMAYTLRSDSTFREDLIWLKKGNEDMSQKFKVKLEEIQRQDKKAREAFENKNKN